VAAHRAGAEMHVTANNRSHGLASLENGRGQPEIAADIGRPQIEIAVDVDTGNEHIAPHRNICGLKVARDKALCCSA
jgi:hypothetical protein